MASVSKITLMDQQALTATTTGDKKSTEPRQKDYKARIKTESRNAATTVDCTIEHSPDGQSGSWETLATLPQITGAPGADPDSKSVSVTGPVFPSVRTVVTLSGATQAATTTVELYYDRG